MVSVFDVAKYFLSLVDEEVGDSLSNLKLQKLVYYAQGFHLALFNRPLFGNSIEAWTHGPVIPELYRAYKEYGAGALPLPTDFDSDIFDRETRELLDEIYQVYGQYSAWMLRDMTHQEGPWVQAFEDGGFGTEIEHKAMQDYFRTQLRN